MKDPDSTTSPEGAPPEAEADLPGFAPSQRQKLDPLDPEQTTVEIPPSSATSPEPEYDPDQPLGEQLDDDELDEAERQGWLSRLDPRNRRHSSTASTEPDPVVADMLEQLAGLGLAMASLGLNRTIGRGNGAWIMHDEEQTAIAAPLARIAARRVPAGDGVAGDVSDGIVAGMATAGYAARAAKDHRLASTVPATPQDQGDLQ